MEDFPEVPAHVRMIVWLGLEKHQEDWTNREETEGDFCVYAETVYDFIFTITEKTLMLKDFQDSGQKPETLDYFQSLKVIFH